MSKSSLRIFVAFAAAALLLGGSIAAQDLATVETSPSGLFFAGKSHTEGFTLRVSTPDGSVHDYAFGAGEAPYFDLGSVAAADGAYKWELRPVAAPRARVEGESLEMPDKRAQSGSFSVHGGGIVSGGEERGVQTKDQVILDDLIVDGSACIGMDCVNGENFGFDTLRLKENNLRVHFQDTSNSASFPTNDWRLVINDSSNGGGNYFAIEDSNAARRPFTVEAGAPANALYVEADGDVGIGTNNPVVDAHIVTGNTPTLRLEQNGSSGFTPQTWDLAGNEANIFIRDATNGSRLPFRIRPGAPSSSIDIAADGDIGMGTDSPGAALHLRRTDATAQVKVEEASSTEGGRVLLDLSNNGTTRISLTDTSPDGSIWFNAVNAGSYAISQSGTGDSEFEISNATTGASAKATFRVGTTDIAVLRANGNLDLLGVVGSLSDRNMKDKIEPVDAQDVLSRVLELPIATWAYKHDAESLHMGPMAQDFYAAFGLYNSDKRIAVTDLSGVALAAIQGLNAKLADKEVQVGRLSAKNADLETRLASLEAIVAAIASAND